MQLPLILVWVAQHGGENTNDRRPTAGPGGAQKPRRTAEPGGGVSHVLCERRRRRVGFRLGLQRNVEGQQYALPDTTLAS